MRRDLSGKRIFITGVCGTVGLAILEKLLEDEQNCPSEIIGVDNNESELFFLDQTFDAEQRVRLFVLDIRDQEELMKRMVSVDIVFHCAALKHVHLSEKSPDQVVQSNIIGVQNVINAAYRNNVEILIFTSSDKAVNPTNVMGASKLMGERLIVAAHHNKGKNDRLICASTRFGNVLGSNGSVVPLFKKQILSGGPVTLTNPSMTRFVMSKQEAANLVIESACIARGGEVFVTKMPVISIETLAKAMIEKLNDSNINPYDKIDIKVIGEKSGEKLFEELMSDEELRRSIELEDFFVIFPALKSLDALDVYPNIINASIQLKYSSRIEDALDVKNTAKLLCSYNLL